MQILFLSLFLPHPHADHAAAFSDYNLIRHLAARHDITLLSFVRSPAERDYCASLAPFCRSIDTVMLPDNFSAKLRSRARLLTLTPLAVSQSYSPEMARKIRTLTQTRLFDVIQVEYTPMGQYLDALTPGNGLRVLNVHDLIAAQMQACATHLPFSRKKLECYLDRYLARPFETRLCSRFDVVLTASRPIQAELLAANPRMNVVYMPPGVNLPPSPKEHHGPGKNLIFMGAMWRQENIDAILYFYHDIFGRIRDQVPGVTLTIAGGSPAAAVQRLAADPQVKVTGYVPDLLPLYLASDISIAPLRIAGGLLCKILDAMAAGLPVVTTSAGNSGVGATPGEEIIIADDPATFAARTVALLQDGSLRQRLSHQGLQFIRQHYSWDHIVRSLESTYNHLLTPQVPGGPS